MLPDELEMTSALSAAWSSCCATRWASLHVWQCVTPYRGPDQQKGRTSMLHKEVFELVHLDSGIVDMAVWEESKEAGSFSTEAVLGELTIAGAVTCELAVCDTSCSGAPSFEVICSPLSRSASSGVASGMDIALAWTLDLLMGLRTSLVTFAEVLAAGTCLS